ncbi:MAG: DUF6106 family protein [Ruminococcus callidus]
MDNFAEYMVKKRPDSRDNAKRAGIIALAVVLCVASVFLVFVTHIPFILLITCAIIYGAYFLITGTSVEYEYAVTNGEMDVDKIIARRKRVHLITVSTAKFDAYGEMTDAVPDDPDRTIVLCSDNTGEGEFYADLETEEYGATRIIFTPMKPQDTIAGALPRQLRFQKRQAWCSCIWSWVILPQSIWSHSPLWASTSSVPKHLWRIQKRPCFWQDPGRRHRRHSRDARHKTRHWYFRFFFPRWQFCRRRGSFICLSSNHKKQTARLSRWQSRFKAGGIPQILRILSALWQRFRCRYHSRCRHFERSRTGEVTGQLVQDAEQAIF